MRQRLPRLAVGSLALAAAAGAPVAVPSALSVVDARAPASAAQLAVRAAAEVTRATIALRPPPHAGTAREVLADPSRLREVLAEGSADEAEPARALDGDPGTAWVGDANAKEWAWTASFRAPVHLGLVRAHWGVHTNLGVPTAYAWEVARPRPMATSCEPSDVDPRTARWDSLEDAHEEAAPSVSPTHRSWFVRADACALRLRVFATNAGPPALREVVAFESARDVLADARVDASGAADGSDPAAAIDGRYETSFRGAAGRGAWSITMRLREPTAIDRVTLVLGLDATSRPRAHGVGRTYGVAASPADWELQASDDDGHYETIARAPTDARGRPLPVRRPLVELAGREKIRALRLVMRGATDLEGRTGREAFPIVREIAAYAADDDRPVLAAPWVLSVNANPSAQSHLGRGGELANDVYFTKFLQKRFATLLPALARDDRYARALAPDGSLRDAARDDASGEAIEAIEGDDPALGPALLEASWPRPLVVLSGANDWDFARAGEVGPDPSRRTHWRWDPLRDGRDGGMAQLAPAVQRRIAPFVGFCGGAQILSLLEAHRAGGDHGGEIDALVRRNDGRSVHGAAEGALQRAWPGQPGPRDEIRFDPADPLFLDIAGPRRRVATHALPEWHVDAIRPDAFREGGPLARMKLVATSRFCAPVERAKAPRWASTRHALAPESPRTHCEVVPEAFRSIDDGWPVVGAQFHPEQYDFTTADVADPPESIADARLFVAAMWEMLVDATLKWSV